MEDQEAFLRHAMETHGDAVYRLALCRLQNRAEAEDVYQDVFLTLLRQPERKWEQDHLKAWLLRTALHRCADVKRRWLRHPVLPLEEIAGNTADTGEDAAELWESVARLPGPMRMAVHLFYGEGYSTEEIAGLLGCSPATVRTRLYRAREKLRDLLGGYEDGKPIS